MRHSRRILQVLKRDFWVLWLASLLSISPAALLYVAVAGRELSHSISQKEVEVILMCVRFLEKPGRLLLPEWRYPLFWHSHLQDDHFWPEVILYFAINFIGWCLVLAVATLGVRIGWAHFKGKARRT